MFNFVEVWGPFLIWLLSTHIVSGCPTHCLNARALCPSLLCRVGVHGCAERLSDAFHGSCPRTRRSPLRRSPPRLTSSPARAGKVNRNWFCVSRRSLSPARGGGVKRSGVGPERRRGTTDKRIGESYSVQVLFTLRRRHTFVWTLLNS